MKTLLLLFALVSTPASAKTWIDAECQVLLMSNPDGYTYVSFEIGTDTFCEMTAWPFNSDTASLQCDNGWTLSMQFVGKERVVIDGVSMNVYDGPIPCGDHDAEWPD
jgi:hypothetical protein